MIKPTMKASRPTTDRVQGGPVITNPNYWDCECDGHVSKYIHNKSVKQCPVCKAEQDEMPDSRQDEVFALWLWFKLEDAEAYNQYPDQDVPADHECNDRCYTQTTHWLGGDQ